MHGASPRRRQAVVGLYYHCGVLKVIGLILVFSDLILFSLILTEIFMATLIK